MKRFLVAIGIGLLVAAPLVGLAAAADSTARDLPAAVDQQMARGMIQLAESKLKVAGYDPGRVDGVFDAQTASALRQYQASRNIPVTGMLDEPTRDEMFPGFHNAGED
jgi:peptidoglycan hydrolase-like protein with peptidoglycan-binding domain